MRLWNALEGVERGQQFFFQYCCVTVCERSSSSKVELQWCAFSAGLDYMFPAPSSITYLKVHIGGRQGQVRYNQLGFIDFLVHALGDLKISVYLIDPPEVEVSAGAPGSSQHGLPVVDKGWFFFVAEGHDNKDADRRRCLRDRDWLGAVLGRWHLI